MNKRLTDKSEAQKIYDLWLEYPTMVERYAWKFGYGVFAYGKIYQIARDGHTVKSICECQS